MSKYVSVLLAVALSCAALSGNAQQSASPKIKNVPIQRTSPTSGEQMYASYCAVCHGRDGSGNGPAAPALKAAPTDLRTLSQKNGGTFPSEHVAAVLQFGVSNPAHGTPDMPIWGDLLRSLNHNPQQGSMEEKQRISNLTDYLKTLQY